MLLLFHGSRGSRIARDPQGLGLVLERCEEDQWAVGDGYGLRSGEL